MRIGRAIWAIIAGLLMALGSTMPAVAADTTTMPRDSFTASPGNVDLRSGYYITNATEFVIGDPAHGGFAFKRTSGNSDFLSVDKLGQFSHNWIVFATQTAGKNDSGNYTITVSGEGLSTTFLGYNDLPGMPPAYGQASSGPVATLDSTVSGSSFYFTYTAPGGEKIVFRNMSGNEVSVGLHKSAYASKISYPNGIVYTMNYNSTPNLTSVVSNAGYALVFEYTTVSGKVLVSKVCGINLAVQTLPSTCPSGVPTVSYGYTGTRMSSITDPTGNTSTMSYTVTGFTAQDAFYKSGASTPWLTNYYQGSSSTDQNAQPIVYKQVFADGHQYDYNWTGINWGANYENYSIYSSGYTEKSTLDTTISRDTTISYATYYDPGHSDTAPIISSGPETVTDPLNRISKFYYCVSCYRQQLQWQSVPGGMKQTNGYDPYGNITSRTVTPNTGSSLTALSSSASFDCTALTNCNKPIYTIDPKGNRTDFAYTSYGAIQFEMQPAPSSGAARPLKLYTYVQKNAYVKDASGGLVALTAPIWMPDTMTECQTAAGSSPAATCDTSAPQRVTTWEYASGVVANNLLARGMVVTASVGGVTTSLRTCYGYDSRGRKISTTSPRGTGSGVCS